MRKLVAPLILVIVSLVVGVQSTVAHGLQLSPIDEWVYYDYLTKVSTQGIVRQGEAVGEPARQHLSCIGNQVFGPDGAACNDPDPELSEYPFNGITSADAYTPAYFWTAYATAKVLSYVGVEELLVGGRLSGPLWLALGMILFCALLRRFKISDPMIVGLGLAYIGAPISFWSYSFLSTDAPSLALGCGLLLLAKLFTEGKVRGAAVVALSVVAVLFKVTNILAVLVTSAFLLAYYLWGRDRGDRLAGLLPRNLRASPDRKFVTTAIAAGAAAVIAQFAWLATRAAIAVGELGPQPYIGAFGINELAGQSVNMIMGTLNSNIDFGDMPDLGYPMPEYFGAPLTWIPVLGVVGALIVRPLGATRVIDAARTSIGVTAFLAGPLLATAMYVTQDFYFTLPARYGLAIAASFLLMYAITFNRWRWVSYGTLAYGIVLCAWSANYAFT